MIATSLKAAIDLCQPKTLLPGASYPIPFAPGKKAILVRRFVGIRLRSDMHRGGGHRACRRAGLPIKELGNYGGISPRFFLGLLAYAKPQRPSAMAGVAAIFHSVYCAK